MPAGSDFAVVVDGVRRPMCCRGCAAVAQAIVDAGLSDFYRYRTEPSPTGRELVPEFLRQAQVYDLPEVQKSFVRSAGEGLRAADLILEGITCAACVWLNERHLARLPGVHQVAINYATRRAHVVWDERRLKLSEILNTIRAIGYEAHPYDPERRQALFEKERKQLLRRLGVAAAFGMQIMTLSVALYVGDWSGVEGELRTFFHWVSLLLTVPVLLYSAQPFFVAAWRDLRMRRLGMDVPVALGMAMAFAGSLWATLTGEGVTYYDAVAMFAFFLLTARYFELSARRRATAAAESLVTATPAVATRLTPDGGCELVPSVALAPGDRVLIRPGETIPADVVVLEGRSTVDERLLTGESLPVAKRAGDLLVGGSLNVDSPLLARVERTGADTVLSAIQRLLDRAQAEKPRLAQLADRVAAWFVAGVLLAAGAAAMYWWLHDPARWLPVTVAVLVVTCPCALSLATPTALAAATGALTRGGLLATRAHALETLARATHFVFDKTGTLTRGELELHHLEPLGDLPAAECLRRATSLESYSEHPIAHALRRAAAALPVDHPQEVHNTPGAGLHGRLEGQLHYLGTPEFVQEHAGVSLAPQRLEQLRADGGTVVLLAVPGRLLAAFVLGDELRLGARRLIEWLQAMDRQVWLLSGDHERAVRRVAEALGIAHWASGLTPADKLAQVRRLQAEGAVVAMVGDGVNDAPVLASAAVSIAMSNAAHLAAVASDMILLSPHLERLAQGVRSAQRTLGIIRQNFAWAVAYNLLAVPAALLGYVTPWLAALGMSLSSLVVVANALRLATPEEGDEAAARNARRSATLDAQVERP